MSEQQKPLILVALLIAAFAVNLDTTIVNVGLPSLVRELHATDSQLQWVVDAYNLAFAAAILAAGSLSDRVGRKGTLLCGLAVFGIASFLGGFATDSGQLIAARTVMGLGAALAFPSTLSLIANVFTERSERAGAIGLWGATGGMAIALGPIIGGWLLQHFSWSSIFFAMTPVAFAGGVLVARFVPTSRDPEAPDLDLPGFVLSATAMSVLTYTIIEAPGYGWASGRSTVGFALAAVLLAAFVWRELSTSAPMLDLGIFRSLRFTAASFSVTVSFFTLLGFIFMFTQFFQFIQGYSALGAGIRLLPVAASVGISSVLGTRLAVRAGTKLVVAGGLLMITAFYLWVSSGVSPTFSYSTIAIQMILYGIGLGLTSAPATEAIMGAVPLTKAGAGSAVNDATRLLGGTLGVAVIGSVFASSYASRLTSTLPAHLPTSVISGAHASVGQALGAAQHLSARTPQLAAALHASAVQSFDHAVSVGCLLAAGVAGFGALIALLLLPSQPPALEQPEIPAPRLAGERTGVQPEAAGAR
ncbi:MAG: DHA2 family efflux MFS transporter permease subunit [Candidatus Dormibacteria bacterium]